MHECVSFVASDSSVHDKEAFMRRFTQIFPLVLAALTLVMSAPAVLAEAVTYNWNNYTAGQSGWVISGSMTVSQLGTITPDKILSFSWTATSGTTSFGGSGNGSLTSLSSGIGTAHLDATLTSLNLPDQNAFSLYSSPYVGSLYWRNNLYAASDYYAATSGGGPQFRSETYSPMEGSAWTIGTNAAAPTPSSVPEIDPATGGSALSLVGGAIAMIEQRRRRRGKAIALTALTNGLIQ